jgi:hypothetical protein
LMSRASCEFTFDVGSHFVSTPVKSDFGGTPATKRNVASRFRSLLHNLGALFCTLLHGH